MSLYVLDMCGDIFIEFSHTHTNQRIHKMSDKIITLATLKDATAQQVFDQVVGHLRKQGEMSANESGSCYYRFVKEDGTVLKCAAGCLIGDDEYEEEFDNHSAGTTWNDLLNREQVPATHQELITKLQHVHDGYQSWEMGFVEVALAYGLTYTPLA